MDYELDDILMDSYKEMTVNAPVFPPKSKQKIPPKKPIVTTLDSTHYVHGRGQQNVSTPATMSQMHPQFHGQVQQEPQVHSASPELIYEVPD